MNQYFDGKYVIVENPYGTDRNGQRAQVVASRDHSDAGAQGLTNHRLEALLTLRFSDGRHNDVIASSVRMSEDQITPVWPMPPAAPAAS